MLLAEEKTDFSREGPFVCSFQTEDPQIILLDVHHQPGPDPLALTSRFAILAAEHKAQVCCSAGWRQPSSHPVSTTALCLRFMNTGHLDFCSRTWISIFPLREMHPCRPQIKKCPLLIGFFCNLSPLPFPQCLHSQCKRKNSTRYMYREARGNGERHEKQPDLHHPC